ncbi:MAG: ABC transporter permease [Alphaproteobacteria bacterium]|nr:ABC transporter permease [Alphaproteobacteria bacterium]
MGSSRGASTASLWVGGGLVGVVIAAALVSLAWTPHPPTAMALSERLQGPSAVHWLGTDHFGRDVATLLMAGARTSIVVGVIAVGLGFVIGVALGVLAAARRGWLDELVMRLCDITFALPAVLSAILLTAWLGPGPATAIVAIGVFNIPVFARIARGAALTIWPREFILAARVAGKGAFRITLEHVLPNIASVLLVQATIQFAIAILAEAALSYLGIGTQPPAPSWGRMLNEAQTFMYLAPGLAVYPGLAIVIAVLGLNLLGDGLRDALDPRLARGR